MKRRRFIKNSIYGSLGGSLILNSLSCERKNFKKITILHTNDVHSHIEPFPKDHSKFPNMGGFERRSTLINNIRLKNPNTLLFDAGDVFQGTPYFNFYGGELEFKLMSMLKYDAMTIGNHDFDNGIDGLNSQLPKASFEIISSNYEFSNTILENKIKRTKTYILDEVKIGVFGLGIELKGLVSDELYKETKYLDPVEISNDITDYLKNEEKCDLIICLSHLGFKYKKNKISDFILAQKTKDIDLIIGGHTHTFMDKPTITKNKIGNDVIINQVGCFGVYLGKIDFYLETNKIKIAKSKLLTI